MANVTPPPPAPASPPERSSTRLRATAILVVVICLFGTLVGRLWYLQGVEPHTRTAFSLAGEGEKVIYTPAPRGEIFDRDGVLLAGDRTERVVTVEPGAVAAHPGIVDELSAVLDEPAARVEAAIKNPQFSPYQPVPVAQGVSDAVMLAIDENRSLLPDVTVQAQSVRYYPFGPETANIVGYVSQITGSEYGAVKAQMCGAAVPCYQPGSQFGQAGVEASFEKYLRGRPGKEVLAVNSQGQVLYRVSYTPPVPGDNVVLSVSLTDQEAAVKALDDWMAKARSMPDVVSGRLYRAPAASMVVEDPRNGQILALATAPDYNPSDFIGGISKKRWAHYNNPANHYPLLDRAISTAYATGSTWKLMTATAALDYGARGPYTSYDDTGSFTVGHQTFHDNDNVPLGPVDLSEAITASSDSYFYSLGYALWQMWAGQRDHPEYLQKVASEYGLGHYSGIALPGEAPGIVPSQQVFTKEHEQYPKAYPDPYFYPGQEVLEAIGQGADAVTPLQLADAYSSFANDGTLYVPQVALAVEAPGTANRANGKILKRFFPQVKGHVQMPDATGRAAMLSGFEGVTSNTSGPLAGTAAAAFASFPLSKYPVAGKTGTAQVGPDYSEVGWPKYVQDTSVFSSFAPADNPRFTVDAFFEQAGYGASVAAPAVEQEYLTLFGLDKASHGSEGASTAVSG
ncbi:MAG: penicillin-binding transpeptidase domain-containing protein [Acidimicrobiales bacterium]